MSQWGYVTLGWISVYLTIGVWYYTSRMPTVDHEGETQESETS